MGSAAAPCRGDLQAVRGRDQISVREKRHMAGLLFLLEIAAFVLGAKKGEFDSLIV